MDDASIRQALRLFLASPDPSPTVVEGGLVFPGGAAGLFARDELVLDAVGSTEGECEAGDAGECGIGAEETRRALLRFLGTTPRPHHRAADGGLWFLEGGREWFARDDVILDAVAGREPRRDAGDADPE